MMRLWIRADASSRTGIGHLMRTWAVAEAADAVGIAVTYVTTASSSARSFSRRWGVDLLIVADPTDRSWHESIEDTDIALFDGYSFNPDDFTSTRDRCLRVGAIDDFGSGEFPVDVLVNPSPLSETDYATLPTTQILVGPRYALVRSEFRKRGVKDPHTTLSTLVVTMGGSDPSGATPRILPILSSQTLFDRVIFVEGPSQSPIQLEDETRTSVIKDPTSMADVFAQATAVISAAGATTWELLTMGTPTALIQTAENQRLIGPAVTALGAALFVGHIDNVDERLPEALASLSDPTFRESLATRARMSVDGFGATRVLTCLSRD